VADDGGEGAFMVTLRALIAKKGMLFQLRRFGEIRLASSEVL